MTATNLTIPCQQCGNPVDSRVMFSHARVCTHGSTIDKECAELGEYTEVMRALLIASFEKEPE